MSEDKVSSPPQGYNDLENPDLFRERLFYKQDTFGGNSMEDTVPIDILYEKPFYGKVDIRGRTVYPSEANMVDLPGRWLTFGS